MKVICYGDSNTYGYDPRSYFGERYAPRDRWVDCLAQKSGWCIVNEGMNGRSIPRTGVDFPRDADMILIMLGTNNLLQGKGVNETVRLMDEFLGKLVAYHDRLVVIGPPMLCRGEWVNEDRLVTESEQLLEGLEHLCRKLKISYVNTALWEIPMSYDGVHFTEAGHRRFADCLYEALIGGCQNA